MTHHLIFKMLDGHQAREGAAVWRLGRGALCGAQWTSGAEICDLKFAGTGGGGGGGAAPTEGGARPRR